MTPDAREQSRHIIETVQAYYDGKEIQRTGRFEDEPWKDDPAPNWDWALFAFRVKPEERKPRVLILSLYKDGEWSTLSDGNPGDEGEIIENATFMEVLPSTTVPREWVLKSHNLGTGMIVRDGPTVDGLVRVREVLPSENTGKGES